jgi:hypothetical protein
MLWYICLSYLDAVRFNRCRKLVLDRAASQRLLLLHTCQHIPGQSQKLGGVLACRTSRIAVFAYNTFSRHLDSRFILLRAYADYQRPMSHAMKKSETANCDMDRVINQLLSSGGYVRHSRRVSGS